MTLHFKHSKYYLHFILTTLVYVTLVIADSSPEADNRVEVTLNGNAIVTAMNNTGSFSGPGNIITDMVWHGLGYAYEINFFLGAEVPVPQGSHPDAYFAEGQWRAHVISDGLLTNGGETSPDNNARWGWQPIASTANGPLTVFDNGNPQIPNRMDIDRDGDGNIDGWPWDWRDDQTGKQHWPALWPGDTLISGPEYLFAMDDRSNKEFEYYPFPTDSTRRGLGVEVTSRSFAYASSDLQNALITIYDIRNLSAYDLDSVKAGLWGDPHIGGPIDWQDDRILYDRKNKMVICSDADGKSLTDPSITPGQMGVIFLQTPGNPNDGIDNDGDGMTDESIYDGIDNDSDWQAKWDDVGADGMANTFDSGEGDGVPTLGEPHFEFTDMDEADMTGLQSLSTPTFSGLHISDDEKIWQLTEPGKFDSLATPGDYVLLPGSGVFPLKTGREKRMAVAFVFGQDRDELIRNAQKARRYYTLHLGNFQTEHPFSVSLTNSARYYTAAFNIQWEASALEQVDSLQPYYSLNNGKSWTAYGKSIPNNGTHLQQITDLPSSAFYKIRLLSLDGPASYVAETDSFFTLDNSGAANVPPEVIWDMSDGVTLQNTVHLNWQEADADRNPLSRKVILSSQVVGDTLCPPGPGFDLSTVSYPNGAYSLILLVSDASSSVSVSRKININNINQEVSDSFIRHKSGYADGVVHAVFPDQGLLKSKVYYITFSRKSNGETTYSVTDSLGNQPFIQGDPLPVPPEYGRFFEGLSLSFENVSYGFDVQNSGWNAGRINNLTADIFRENSYPEFLSDYEIHFVQGVGDTSVNNISAPFYIVDKHTQERLDFAITELSATQNGQWDTGEIIYILRGGQSSSDIVWRVVFAFGDPDNPIAAAAGETYTLSVHKPFSEADSYSLNTTVLDIEPSASVPARYHLENNYPNPFNPVTTIAYQLPRASRVRLEIFDMLGRKVRTLIDGRQRAGRHVIHFNAGPLASGAYVYVLRAGKDFVESKKLILLK